MRWIASRREVLSGMAAALIAALMPWRSAASPQEVRHILPTADDTQLSVTISLWQPRDAVRLSVDEREFPGKQMDSAGRHWTFHAHGLTPGTTYQLQLLDPDGPFYEAWPLKTLPYRDSLPEALKVLAFTCAGGGDGFGTDKAQFFKPHKFRQRMFESALAESPDLALAIGDHIYWDLGV